VRSGQSIADRYRLVELIGSGGSGLVWLAEDLAGGEAGGRQVALKRPHSAVGPSVRTELEREARVAARVRHPNAIRVYQVAGDAQDSWLVMEYFPAKNLGVLLHERGPLDPGLVAHIGLQVCAALDAIHAADVVHRDVTPNNILVAPDGTAKVTDYGISAHRAQTVTSSGKISGTAVYVSPEVADGSGAKAPSDVFSLGASLFAAVEGEPPFGFGDPDMILARIRAGNRRPVERAGPLAPVLEAMLQPERDARPTAAQARAMLERVVAGEPVEPWVPPVRRARRWPLGSRRARVLTAAGAVVVVALGLVAWSPWGTSAGEAAHGPLRTVLGDPRTADPCALVDPKTFRRYGPAVVDPAYGNFNRCDVLIDLGHDTEMDIDLELLARVDPNKEPPQDAKVEVEKAETDDDGGCDVSITLADLNRIDVNARPHGDVKLDACEVAQVAGDRALELLPPDELKRRPAPFDADSLARVDGCSLLDRNALSVIPGLDPEPSVAFGRWYCEWSGRAAKMRTVLYFNQNTTLTAEDGQLVELAGHHVFIQPQDGGGECDALVVHRPVHLDNGEDIDEIVTIEADGDQPMNKLCTTARKLARSVASHLPPAGS
jgi:eukaryotic-like serine/threonine-protein kinase